MGWLASLALAVAFLAAAAGKLTDQAGTRRAAIEFGVPAWAASRVAVAVPTVEVGVAVLLVSPWRQPGVWVAIVLLALFTAAIVLALARGHRPECRCFGSVSTRPVGPATLLRNGALAGVAAVALLAPADARLTAAVLGWSVAAATAAVCGAVLAAVLSQQGRLLARVEALEVRLATALAAGPLMQPTGRPVPRAAEPFSLPDRDGLTWTTAQLTGAQGVVLLFVDKDCATCHEALPGMLAARRDGQPVALVARHPDGRWPDLAGARLLVDADGAVASTYGVTVVPAAVFIGPDGWVRREVAVGPDAIRHAFATQTLAADAPATPEEGLAMAAASEDGR
jgi:MFS family permease